MSSWDFETPEQRRNRAATSSQPPDFGQMARNIAPGLLPGIGPFAGLLTNPFTGPPLQRAIGTGFELLGRPAAGLRGFAGEAIAGRNPLAGFARGITGEEGFHPIGSLEAAGVPSPLREIGAFGIEAAVDPLNLIPVGRIAGGGSQARRFIRGVSPLESFVPPPTPSFEQAFRPSALEPVLHQAAKLPMVKGVVDRISRRILEENPVGQRLIQFNAERESGERAATAVMAKLRAAPLRGVVDADGRYMLPDGERLAWGDLFQHPEALNAQQFQGLGNDLAYIRNYQQTVGGLRRFGETEINKALGNLPDLKAHFDIDYLDLPPGAAYIPRYATNAYGDVVQVRRFGERGAQKGFQKEREWVSQEQAISEGMRYLGPDETLRQFTKDVYDQVAQARLARAVFQEGQRVLLERAEQTATIGGVSYLRDIQLPRELAEQVGAWLGREAQPVVKGLGTLSGFMRAFQTTLDTSAPFIQGVPLLLTRPDLWVRGFGRSLQAMIDPRKHQAYLARPENQEIVKRMPDLVLSGSEFFQEAAGAAGLLGRIPGAGRPLAGAFRRGQAGFEAFGDFARIEWAKSLIGTAEKSGQTTQLANMINHATGVLSTTAMGVSPTQRATESFLLFAPRYLRSAFALVGDIGMGGATSAEAAKTIGSMMIFGQAWYQAVARALDQEPILDPSDGRFMTVEMNGQRIGIGGVWVSLLRALGNLGKTASENPGALLNFDVLDPKNDNPIVRFWRGKMAPGPGMVWDIAMDENYNGDPLQSTGDVLKNLGTRLFPFSVEGFLIEKGRPGQTPESLATGTAGPFLGLRTFPEGFKDISQAVAREKFGADYDALNPVQKAQVQEDPRVKQIEPPRGKRFEETRQVQAIQGDYRAQLETAAEQVERGEITPAQFRLAAHAAVEERRTRFAQLPERERRGPQTEAQQQMERYFDMLKAKDQYGRTDYEAADAFLAAQSQETRDLVRQTEDAGLARLGPKAKVLMQELWAARDRLRPYWEKRDDALRRVGLSEQWENANPAERDALTRTPRYKAAERLWDRQRELLRRRNPQMDADLARWYGLTPIRQQRR